MSNAPTRRQRTAWQPAMLELLQQRYPHEATSVVAKALGLSLQSVYQKATKLGLKKTAEFLRSPQSGRTTGNRGAATRFQPGQRAWNKGMKGLNTGGGATRFQPGLTPHNQQPIGSYRITPKGALQQKISHAKGNNSKRWRCVHELVWIAQHGALPASHVVVFKAGMHTNRLEEITLDRLECISRAELMRRNTLHNYPKEIVQLLHLRGQLNKKIKQQEQHHE